MKSQNVCPSQLTNYTASYVYNLELAIKLVIVVCNKQKWDMYNMPVP